MENEMPTHEAAAKQAESPEVAEFHEQHREDFHEKMAETPESLVAADGDNAVEEFFSERRGEASPVVKAAERANDVINTAAVELACQEEKSTDPETFKRIQEKVAMFAAEIQEEMEASRRKRMSHMSPRDHQAMINHIEEVQYGSPRQEAGGDQAHL